MAQTGNVEDSGVPPFKYELQEIPYEGPTREGHGPKLLIMQKDSTGNEYLFGEISPLVAPREAEWAVEALNRHTRLKYGR